MAITVTVQDAKIADGALALAIETTNDAHPDEAFSFAGTYATSMTAIQVKAAIDTAVTLLWTAVENKSWTV